MITVAIRMRELHITNSKENAGEDLVILPLEDVRTVIESIKEVAYPEEFKKRCALGITVAHARAARVAFEEWLRTEPAYLAQSEEAVGLMWKAWQARGYCDV